jgi:23S rRNA (uridine2552-2'-O)-methyltransferase
LAINEKDKLIRPGMLVIDLGSAPGGWSQVASKLVGTGGKVIASDILPMDSLPDVEFIQGDFTEDSVFEQILHAINENPVDVVISDMAPNLSGIATADQAASIYLIELALDMAQQVLKPKGSFIAKAFQGEGYEAFVKEVRNHFDTVVIRKPEASRSRSREVYVVGKGFRG